MAGAYQTKEKPADTSHLLSQHLKARRQSLLAVQWFFYSAIACLWPFLYSTHASDVGLNSVERSAAQLLSSLGRLFLIGPCIQFGLHVQSLRRARWLLALSLFTCVALHLALLAVPRTIRLARQPRVSLNCSHTAGGQIRVEWCEQKHRTCPPMGRQSLALVAQNSGVLGASASTTFSTFSLGVCRRLCTQQLSWSLARVAHGRTNSLSSFSATLAGEPSQVRVCFHKRPEVAARSSNEETRCYHFDPHLPAEPSALDHYSINYSNQNWTTNKNMGDFRQNTTLRHVNQLEFHSKADAWISLTKRPQLPNLLHPYFSCLYAQSQPVFIEGDNFERLSCSDTSVETVIAGAQTSTKKMPSVESSKQGSDQPNLPLDYCETVCSVNLLQRNQLPAHSFTSGGGFSVSVHPTLCEQVHGDPLFTFTLYSTFRVLGDACLLLAHLIIISLHTYHTCNLQLLHGGSGRALCIGSAGLLWPTISGFFLHWYNDSDQLIDYAPCFLLFAGHMLIAAALVCVLPLAPAWLELQATLNSRYASNLYLTEQMIGTSNDMRKSGIGSSSNHLPGIDLHEQHPSLSTTTLHLKQAKSRLLYWLRSPGQLFALTCIQSMLISICNTQLPVYLVAIGYSRHWLGIAESVTWTLYSSFALAAGTCLATLGKRSWLLLGLCFHVFLLSAISVTYEPSKWQLIFFGCMRSFAFPLYIMAVSAMLHAQRPRNRMQHVQLQLWLQYILFAVGPFLAAFFMLLIQLPWFQLYLQFYIPSWLRWQSADLLSTHLPQIMLLDQLNIFRLICRLFSVGLLGGMVGSFLLSLLYGGCKRVCTYEPAQTVESSQCKQTYKHTNGHPQSKKKQNEQQTLLPAAKIVKTHHLKGIQMIDEIDEAGL